MSAVIVLAIIISTAVVFAVAAVIVGREARRLDAVAPRVIYVLDQATQFVADRLPARTQSRLTFDELRKILELHMGWMHEHGLQPDEVTDLPQQIDNLVIASEADVATYLFKQAKINNIEILEDEDIHNVVKIHLEYFDQIGAIGPIADSLS